MFLIIHAIRALWEKAHTILFSLEMKSWTFWWKAGFFDNVINARLHGLRTALILVLPASGFEALRYCFWRNTLHLHTKSLNILNVYYLEWLLFPVFYKFQWINELKRYKKKTRKNKKKLEKITVKLHPKEKRFLKKKKCLLWKTRILTIDF